MGDGISLVTTGLEALLKSSMNRNEVSIHTAFSNARLGSGE